MLPPTLPLFPLPNVVLFPNVFLPLHIFEPRYRDMVADALDGDRMIGMVLLRPGWEGAYEGRPPVYPVGCAGLITHSERLSDGRYNIVLRGLEKFRIAGEDDSRAYRQARVVVAHATRGSIEVALHGWTHCIPDRGRHLPRWIGSNRAWHREPEAIEPSVGCKWFGYALGVPVTQYVAPGSPVPEGWRVWHDRDFVLHWEDSMDELEAALCARD